MRQTVEQYWDGQLAALKRRSVSVQAVRGATGVVYHESEYAGIIDVRIWFNDDCVLDAYEHVQVADDGIPHRTLYSYHLTIPGKESTRWDYDPKLPEDLRYHINETSPLGEPLHTPSERRTLVSLVEEAWDKIYADQESDDA